jgi:hypothetical protein
MNIGPLGNIHKLWIGCIHLEARGFSLLGNVHVLYLFSINNLVDDDLKSLGKIAILTLQACHGIQNVDCLSTVKSLSLLDCRGILDFDSLHDVPRLKIQHLGQEVRDFRFGHPLID